MPGEAKLPATNERNQPPRTGFILVHRFGGKMRKPILFCFLAVTITLAQVSVAQQEPATGQSNEPTVLRERSGEDASALRVTLPTGTKIPLVLKQAISTKSARSGDPVYAETNFPVVVNGKIIVPPGTYVQGVVSRVERPGRVKGRAQILIHFTSMIFPSGYTVLLPGSLDNVPGAENSKMKGDEETVEGSGSKGKDAATVANTTMAGTAIGGLVGRDAKGAGVGALGGGLVGLAAVLLSRGPDLRFDTGTTLEMVLERPVEVNRERALAKP